MADNHDFLLNAGVKIDASQASNEVKDFVESVKSSFQNTKSTNSLKKKIQELGAEAVKNGSKIKEFYKIIGNQAVKFNVTKSGRVELGKDKIVYKDITAELKHQQEIEKEKDKQIQKQKDAYQKISDKIFIMTSELKMGVYQARDFSRIARNIQNLKLGFNSLTAEDAQKAQEETDKLSTLLKEQEKKFKDLALAIRQAMTVAGEGPIDELKTKLRDLKLEMKAMSSEILQKGMKGSTKDVEADLEELNKKAQEVKQTRLELQTLDSQLEISWAEITGGAKGKAKAELDVLKAKLANFKEQFKTLGETSGPAFDEIKRNAFETQRQIEKLTKKVKPSQIKKLATTIKRVGFYRIARNIFKTIENGFKEFQSQLVGFGDHINTTVSQTNTAVDKINASFALMLSSLSGLISPILNDIADSFANFANDISKTTAVIKGQNKYLAISKDYWRDMAEEANSLNASFDKFETLSGDGAPKGDIFKEVGITEGEAEAVGATELANNLRKIQELDLTKTLREVYSAVESLWSIAKTIYPSFKKILDVFLSILPTLVDFAETVLDVVSKVVLWLDKNNLLIPALITLGVVLAGIKFAAAIKHIKEMGLSIKGLAATMGILVAAFSIFVILKEAPQWTKYLMLVVGGLVAVAGAILAIKSATRGIAGIVASVGAAITLGATLSLVAKKTANDVPKMKDGGVLPKGTPFIAGEAGAELVHSMPNSNKTGVTNIEQFTQAMINANYQSSGLFQSLIEAALNNCGHLFETNIDGAAVARSKSFKNELNRTNSGLNLR